MESSDPTYGLPHVIIPNMQTFAAKKSRLLAAGLSQLQLISDFDKTLTPMKANGRSAVTTYGVLERSDLLSKRFHERAKELYDKYSKIEFAVDIPHEEKLAHMIDWWTLANENLVQENVPYSVIAEGVQKSNTALRVGVNQLCSFLAANDVPMILFSAGLGDVLQEMLRYCGVQITDNMHTISNFVRVDEKNVIVGFQGRMVHVLNKNEHSTVGTPFHSLVAARKSVILLGDHIGDLGMSKGVAHDVVLNIGFYNEDKVDPARKDLYLKNWDVLLTDDAPMTFVLRLLDELAAASAPSKK